MAKNDALVIGWSFSKDNDRDTLIVMHVGRDNKAKVIKAFYNEEAYEIYERLTGEKYENGE